MPQFDGACHNLQTAAHCPQRVHISCVALTACTTAQSSALLQQVHISCVEIYNEAAFDLLATARDQVRSLEDLQRVHMLEDAEARVHLRNLSVHRADTEEAALNLVSAGRSHTPARVVHREGSVGCIPCSCMHNDTLQHTAVLVVV